MESKQLPPNIKDIGGLMITYYRDIRTQLLEEKADEKLIQIIEYVATNGSITNSEIQKMLNVSKVTATRLLWKADAWLEQEGKVGKGTKHVFKWKKIAIGS